MSFTHALSTNNYGPAKYIVSANAYEGTHTTIAAALTSASSGDTIFIRPGTYTENLTLKAGVNLTAFPTDSGQGNGQAPFANVIISGKCTMTTAGTVTISGIQLQTNSDFLLAVTGSAASIVCLKLCFLNCTNNTGISLTSSGGAQIIINNCQGDLGTTGIAYFAQTNGTLVFNYCNLTNSGSSTTASTASAGSTSHFDCQVNNPITTSSSNVYTATGSVFNVAGTINLTVGSSTSNSVDYCKFSSSTASCISIGGTLSVYDCEISSSNTNTITGAGTLTYSGLIFTNTSNVINTTTLTANYVDLGKWRATGQPVFSAVLSATDANVTGDSTTYVLGSGNVLTVTQQGTNMTTGGTFTAPVTGYYLFTLNLTCTGSATATDALLQLTGTATYNLCRQLPKDTNTNSYNGSLIVKMTATNTATVSFRVDGITKIIGVIGGAGNPTSFTGCLLA